MINRIQLKNVQLHESLDLELSISLNLFSGDSGTGKSCIFKALQFLCGMSSISFEDLLREGAKELAVKVWVDNGFQVERVRSASVNRYILSKDGCEDKVFDSIGRTVPEEIQQVLSIEEIQIDNEKINLNFADQDQLNFILDDKYSDIFKAKLFNKLTGNELIDQVFKNLNKESLSIKRDITSTEETLVKQEEDLVKYSEAYSVAKEKLDKVSEKFTKLQEEIKIYEEIRALSDKIKVNKEGQEFVAFQISKIKIVSDEKINALKKEAEQIDYVKKLMNESITLHNKIVETEEQIKRIKVVDIDFESLKKEAKQIEEVKQYVQKWNELKNKQAMITLQIKEMEQNVVQGEEEYNKEWEKCPTCPLCKQGIKHEA